MGLAMGPLDQDAAHLVIDVQTMFAQPGEWFVPSLAAIVPNIAALARHRPERTLFARFMPPATPARAHGIWQRYYRRWHAYTAAELPAGATDIVPDLAAFARPADCFDKPGHSAFGNARLHERLRAMGVTALVVSGIETDVCVLATVLEAVDRGYRVVVAGDAVTSGSPAGHAATLEHVLPRLDQQVEIAATATILADWIAPA